MSAPKEGSATGEPKDEGARATAETPRGAPAGAPRGSSALSGEDLSTAYNLGLRNNNELTQQLLLDQVGFQSCQVERPRGLICASRATAKSSWGCCWGLELGLRASGLSCRGLELGLQAARGSGLGV